MKELPLLFSAPMIQAILAGNKTQTRRIVKPQPFVDAHGNACWNGRCFGQDFNGPLFKALVSPFPCSKTKRVICPYGKPGDQIWVKETWQAAIGWDNTKPREIARNSPIFFPADNTVTHADGWDEAEPKQYGKLRPSIFMPRWASRIQLEITGIRIERLQDCSDADTIEEGIDRTNTSIPGYAKARYEKLWESINGSGSWEENPWVWVIEFRVIKPQPEK